MTNSNGVIRIGRKGIKKFAFGDGEPFEVDVVTAFQGWVGIDDGFRTEDFSIPNEKMPDYHHAAVRFVEELSCPNVPAGTVTTAEALDFIARLRECYDEVAAFFRPRSRDEPDSQGSSGVELRFLEEGS